MTAAWPAHVLALIPAYRPPVTLISLIDELRHCGCPAFIVVDDGSGPAFDGLFDALRGVPGVSVLSHPINLGKGAALKTGMSHALLRPDVDCVVTIDADGQH